MKKYISASVLLLSIVFSTTLFAQGYLIRKANKLYNQYDYAQAIYYYKKIILADTNQHFVKKRLADCYRKNADATNAAYWYAQFVTDTSNNTDKLNYAQVLQQVGNTKDATKWYQQYLSQNPNDLRGINGLKACKEIQNLLADSLTFEVTPVWFNSTYSDMCPVPYKNGFIFSSDRLNNYYTNTWQHGWTQRPFYNLYYVDYDKINKKFSTPTLLKGKVNSKYHDATASFNQTQNEFYFTRNNYSGLFPKFSNDGVMKLKIYHQSKALDGNWQTPIEFAHNNNNYDVAHPSISADGQWLYFSSNMPGGVGGMDLYVCKLENGQWGSPKNLGPQINTEGNEVFPTLISNNTLYFSSNAHIGIGGLDIFYTILNTNGQWSKPTNVGKPINSNKDDFGICFYNGFNEGYFSSSRSNNDDIFYFTKKCINIKTLIVDDANNQLISNAQIKISENNRDKETMYSNTDGMANLCLLPNAIYKLSVNADEYDEGSFSIMKNTLKENQVIKIALSKAIASAPLMPDAATNILPDTIKGKIEITGLVYNEGTKEPMEGVLITLENYCNKQVIDYITTADGKYHFDLMRNCKYKITAAKNSCGVNWNEFSTENVRTNKPIQQGFGMYCTGDVVKIENIYYDLDKANIRADAARELDLTVATLKKYPTMKIELRSHTDCRADNLYNLELSQNRAESAVAYLISRGIDGARLKAQGYGETMTINKCKDGVPCTEAEHQANRRTEFKIVGFK